MNDTAMNVQPIRLAQIDHDPQNARRHPEAQLQALASSLRQSWGQYRPLLLRPINNDRYVCIAGNGLLQAAREYTDLDRLDAIVLDISDEEAIALSIADNKLGDMSYFDTQTLNDLMDQLQGTEMESLMDEIDVFASEISENEPVENQEDDDGGHQYTDVKDDGPADIPDNPATEMGDVWHLGDHRLCCGDSTDEDHVKNLMGTTYADLMLTDPPYNVALGMETEEQARARNRRVDGKVVLNDKMPDEDFRRFLVHAFSAGFSHMKPGASFYIFHADSESVNFRGAISDCGEVVRQGLVWLKSSLVMGRQDYQWIHEPCIYGWKSGAAHCWKSDRRQTTVMSFDKPSKNDIHPTMKPVPLFSYLVENSSNDGDVVYDPFIGSGTSIVASEQVGRVCYGMELSPEYCDSAVRRWETMTGRTAARYGPDGTEKPGLEKI